MVNDGGEGYQMGQLAIIDQVFSIIYQSNRATCKHNIPPDIS